MRVQILIQKKNILILDHRRQFMLENYPDVLSTKDVCKILRISPHTLYELIKHKELLARKIGGKYKIRKDNLLKLLNE